MDQPRSLTLKEPGQLPACLHDRREHARQEQLSAEVLLIDVADCVLRPRADVENGTERRWIKLGEVTDRIAGRDCEHGWKASRRGDGEVACDGSRDVTV